ncbi:hypothetical protein, partial [Lacticaseibacillus sp. N501-2]|uniref:hypothetical protein n=1 Tax=Lacticaseibacillus salsurae TaxID=3367729 RepID=UPI0038B2409E
MIIFLVILLAISVLAFISGFVLMIVSFVTKKPIKRSLYVLGGGAVLSLLLLIGLGAYQSHLDAVEQARVAKLSRGTLFRRPIFKIIRRNLPLFRRFFLRFDDFSIPILHYIPAT